MKRFIIELPYSFNLFLIGDDHEGTILRYDGGWNKMCNMVNSPYYGLESKYNYVVHHGDFVEAILCDDYRADELTQKTHYVLKQLDEAQKNFEPIKDKMLVMLDGNHPRKLHRFGEVTKHFCNKYLQKPEIFGTWASHITYTHQGKVLFKHFCTHGKGPISSVAGDIKQQKANMEVQLKRKLKNKFGDTFLNSMGDTHKLMIAPPLGYKDNTMLYLLGTDQGIKQKYAEPEPGLGFIHPDFRWYVNTGSFQRLYIDMPEGQEVSGYGEVANYDPVELGFAVGLVRDGKLIGVYKETI